MKRFSTMKFVFSLAVAGILGATASQAAKAQAYYSEEFYATDYPTTTYIAPTTVVREYPVAVPRYYADPRLVNVGVPGLLHASVGGPHLLHLGLPLLHFNLF